MKPRNRNEESPENIRKEDERIDQFSVKSLGGKRCREDWYRDLKAESQQSGKSSPKKISLSRYQPKLRVEPETKA